MEFIFSVDCELFNIFEYNFDICAFKMLTELDIDKVEDLFFFKAEVGVEIFFSSFYFYLNI